MALKLWFYVPTYQLRLDLSVHGKSVAKVAYRTENTNDDIFLHDIGQKRPSWVFIFCKSEVSMSLVINFDEAEI